jgi:hypothetical protein
MSRTRSAPIFRIALLVVEYFAAVSALAGGILGVFANGAGVPLSYLAHTPFDSYLVPGLILAIVVGGTQLTAAITLQRDAAWALPISAVAGFGMLIWIFVELAVIGQYSWLQTLYFAVGGLELMGVLVLLGVVPTRWIGPRILLPSAQESSKEEADPAGRGIRIAVRESEEVAGEILSRVD